jgi:hypothetical protein
MSRKYDATGSNAGYALASPSSALSLIPLPKYKGCWVAMSDAECWRPHLPTSSRPTETPPTPTYQAGLTPTYSLRHVPARRCLLLLTSLVLTHYPSYLLTYLLIPSRPTERVSTSIYEAGTHSLTILTTYLLTHFITSHRDDVYFYQRGWYSLTNHPT